MTHRLGDGLRSRTIQAECPPPPVTNDTRRQCFSTTFKAAATEEHSVLSWMAQRNVGRIENDFKWKWCDCYNKEEMVLKQHGNSNGQIDVEMDTEMNVAELIENHGINTVVE